MFIGDISSDLQKLTASFTSVKQQYASSLDPNNHWQAQNPSHKTKQGVALRNRDKIPKRKISNRIKWTQNIKSKILKSQIAKSQNIEVEKSICNISNAQNIVSQNIESQNNDQQSIDAQNVECKILSGQI